MMEKSEIKKTLLAEIGSIVRRELTPDDAPKTFRELGVDSLAMVEILVMVEREFGIKPMESGLGKQAFSTVDNLAAGIKNLTEG